MARQQKQPQSVRSLSYSGSSRFGCNFCGTGPDLNLTGKPPGSPQPMRAMREMTAAFQDDMTQVLIPIIDSNSRTIPDRDRRAMAGLSMGGMQTFQVTFDHLDLFSYIGGFGGVAGPLVPGNEKRDAKTAFNGALADPAAFAERV